MDLLCPKYYALLSQNEWIHNFQVTDIFKSDVISKIPTSWYSCLHHLSNEELNEVPFLGSSSSLKYPEWPQSLHQFLLESDELSSLRNKISEVKPVDISFSMARGMNSKKLHEVSRMAALVYGIATEAQCDIIIDIGSGLGYLDHVLHQKYGLKIIGMETVLSHASAAEKRAVKQGIKCDGVKSLQCHIEDNDDSYAAFVSTIENVCPTLQCECAKNLADKTHAATEGQFSRFPLSDHGKTVYREFMEKHEQPFITPYTLRLGAQETRYRWRHQTKTDHESHVNHVAFRGLLSITVPDEEECDIRQKVRHCNFDSIYKFIDSYCGSSSEDLSTSTEKRSQILSVYEQHKKDFDAIEILTLLQVIVQPVVESLLYLDRQTWLNEQGHDNVKIVPVFDEYISPRNLCLVASKI